MLQRALDVSKTWVALPRKARAVYSRPVIRQWTSDSDLELRTLTAASSKSNFAKDTAIEYRPHDELSRASSFVTQKKTLVQRLLGDRFTGWRFGVLHFAVWATIVFIINLTVTIWGSTQRESGILLDGDCDRVKNLNTALHVLINVLSTILLSGSNYCMVRVQI